MPAAAARGAAGARRHRRTRHPLPAHGMGGEEAGSDRGGRGNGQDRGRLSLLPAGVGGGDVGRPPCRWRLGRGGVRRGPVPDRLLRTGVAGAPRQVRARGARVRGVPEGSGAAAPALGAAPRAGQRARRARQPDRGREATLSLPVWALRALLVAVALCLWFWTQALIAKRAFPEGKIGDRLLDLTAPLNQALQRNHKWANALLITTSAIIDMLGLFLLARGIFGPSV